MILRHSPLSRLFAAALAAVLITAAPAAADHEFSEPPPDDPFLTDPTFDDPTFDDPFLTDPTFDDPTFDAPGIEDPFFAEPVSLDGVDFPEGFDPALPQVSIDPVTGFPVNTETGLVFDPLYRVIFDPFGTDAWDADTGELLPAPDLFPADPAPTGAPAVEPPADGQPTAGGPVTATPHVDEDPVLALYGTDFTIDDLAAYSFATADLPAGAVDDAFQFAAYEIALLFEMGAFARDTPWYDTFADLHRQFDLGDTQGRNLVQTFAAVDQEFARRTGLLQPSMDPVDDHFVGWTIATLDAPFYDALTTGTWEFLVGHEYAAGLLRIMASGTGTDIVANGGVENVQLEVALVEAIEALAIQQDLNALLLAEAEDLRAQVAALTDPAIRTLLPVADTVAEAGDDVLLYVVIGGIAAGLLIAAAVLLRRVRRRPDVDEMRAAHEDAIETAQLLAGADDEADIVGILDRAAERQVGAPLTLLHVTPEGLRPAGQNAIVAGSDLERVVRTGQKVVTILHDDPAFPGTSVATMAVPVISDGTARAVLAAARTADAPFSNADLGVMETIAPALGGAIRQAARLGTMEELAMIDGLTSLGNRRRLDGDLETNLASAVAGGAPLGFAMIDVDHFKTYNDTHGHTAGDAALQTVAATIAACVRDTDVVYRYGGEEFSMLLPGASPEEAAAIAERVRAAVEETPIAGEERQPGGRLTVSVGVATLASGGGHDIRERADRALYAAKAGGRNQVVVA